MGKTYAISFPLQKGGVGKTSIAGNVGSTIAEEGLNVLFIDCDQQGNLTRWLSQCENENIEFELSDVLNGNVPLHKAILKTGRRYDIVPTNSTKTKLREYAETQAGSHPFAFDDLLRDAEHEGYDIVIFDTAPSSGIFEQTILRATDEVITPMSPEFFSTEGITIFRNFLERTEKQYRKEIRHNIIILNMINKSFLHHKQFSESIREFKNFTVLEIPQDTTVAKSQALRLPLCEYDPNNTRSLPAIRNITSEVLQWLK